MSNQQPQTQTIIGPTFDEIPATDIRKGDMINLVHEVRMVRRNRDFGWLVVHTNVIDARGALVMRSKLTLYPSETVIRTAVDR